MLIVRWWVLYASLWVFIPRSIIACDEFKEADELPYYGLLEKEEYLLTGRIVETMAILESVQRNYPKQSNESEESQRKNTQEKIKELTSSLWLLQEKRKVVRKKLKK